MLKKIIAAAMAVAMALSMAACGKPNGSNAPASTSGAAANLSGKAYIKQSFDGESAAGVLSPAVDSAGELLAVSQDSGKAAVITTYDTTGKKKSSVETDVTDTVTFMSLGQNDAVYLLAEPTGGLETVHVLGADGKTSKTIALAGMKVPTQNTSGAPAFGAPSASASPAPSATPAASAAPGATATARARNGNGGTGGNAGAGGFNMRTRISGMAVSPDGSVLVSAMGSGVLEFDQTGKQTRTIGSASTTADMAINEKGQLLVYSSGQGMGGGGGTPSLKTYDTASGQQVSSIDVTGIGNMQSFFYDKAGKRVLYMTADDIRQLSADGKTNTVLLSFTDFALLTGDRQMMSFAVDGQGTIYLADYNSDAATASTGTASASSGQSALMGGGAMAYVFGGTNSANETMRFGLVDASTIPPVKTITLAALNDTRTLDRVISLFEVANPGDRIVPKYYNTTVQGYGRITGGTGNGQFDVSSLVQALNTDLMSGQGADLIVLDDLPWYKYVDKGLLLDLGQLMTQKNFDTTQYFTNILDACKVGGKLYGVPTSFSYSILTGKTADLPSSGSQQIADFLTKAKALPQGENAFQNEDATRLFESFMSNSYPDLVDTATHKANFDSPEFIQAMNDFKTLLSTNASTTQQQSDRGGFGPGGMMGAQAGQVNGTVAYDIESVTNPMVIMELRGISDSNNLGMSYMDIPTLSGSASGTFTTSMMFGINASTKNQDAAWLFIQTMLGSDIQGLGSAVLGGYPVLKSASDAAVDTYTKASTLGTNGQIEFRMGANSPSIVIKPLTSTDAQAIKTTLSSLNKLQSIDPNILQVLNEELPTFFSGQKTADEVAGLIQNRVNTIINE